jgi:hypothetical protein
MKNYILSFLIGAHIFCTYTTLSCPYHFSPDDQRPFFEQYETEINPVAQQIEKEEKS